MESGWTEAVARDLEAYARLVGLAQCAEDGKVWERDEQTLPLFPEEVKEPVVQARTWTHSGWHLMGRPQRHRATPVVETPPVVAAVPAGWRGSWPAIKAAVGVFLQTWPRHAPLLPRED